MAYLLFGYEIKPSSFYRNSRVNFFIALAVIFSAAAHCLAIDSMPGVRIFSIEESIALKNFPQDAKQIQLWVPYPIDDTWQVVDDFKLEGPFTSQTITDKEYGNKILYLKGNGKRLSGNNLKIKISFKVQRKEHGISDIESSSLELSPGKSLRRFLEPDTLVPVNGEIKKLAQKITQGKNSDLEKVRAIYDYLIDELTYAKDDPKVCGLGNSLLTLEFKKGICTDYHSLFISLARSLGIPAKFEIGFRLPEDTREGKLNGYHCWAKFYLKDRGWIPVDISEADKHPQKRDYFFGAIDENRIHLTSGRDINLQYAKDLQPLNFFVYPYIEVNGKEFSDVETNIFFKEEGGA